MSEGIPLHGDRGAWDVINFDDEHARDIMDGTLQRHLPLPGAAGGRAVSDGGDWQRADGGLSGVLILDDGENWRVVLTFVDGLLTEQSTGVSEGAAATWT